MSKELCEHRVICYEIYCEEIFISESTQQSVRMSGALESYVNRPVSVITADGRNFVGTLKVAEFFLVLS